MAVAGMWAHYTVICPHDYTTPVRPAAAQVKPLVPARDLPRTPR